MYIYSVYQGTHLIGRRVKRALMIIAQCLQRDLHLLAHLFERRQLLTYLARFPVDLVERFDVRRNDIGALGLLERMATQHLLAHGGRMFRILLKKIN